MKKLALLCSLVLAFYVSALAQTDTSGSKSNPSAANQSSSQMQNSNRDKADSFGKSINIKGCLTQQDGKYLVTDKKHPEGIELTGSQDLSAHVGHKVEIKGTWAESAASGSSTPASSGNTANPASSASSSTSAGVNPSAAAQAPGNTNPAAMGSTSGNASQAGGKAISVTEVKMISDKCDQSASDTSYKK